MTGYRDHWIECTDEKIQVRGYYFPWGTKGIPCTSIRSVHRVAIGALTGKGRICGTGNLRCWASLEPQRPSKKIALILDLGRPVRPFLTPDDPAADEGVIREHTKLPPSELAQLGATRTRAWPGVARLGPAR